MFLTRNNYCLMMHIKRSLLIEITSHRMTSAVDDGTNTVITVLYRNGVVPELHREKGLPRRDKGVTRLIMAGWAAR